MNPNGEVAVVWFKRDLRLDDHQPLKRALASKYPVVLLYIVEPDLVDDPHYSLRHWRFIWQSLREMNLKLEAVGAQVTIMYGDALSCLHALHQDSPISALYSYQEIGLEKTFARDRQVESWCENHKIPWIQSSYAAVIRGAKSRQGWDKHWQKVMREPLAQVCIQVGDIFCLSIKDYRFTPPTAWTEIDPNMQIGGSDQGLECLHSFFKQRGKEYYRQLSSPVTAMEACSRLSAYLAWGNLSLRQVYQQLLTHWQKPGWRRSLVALSSRLHWHCHFIQKFESEPQMEHRCLNRAYEPLLASLRNKPPLNAEEDQRRKTIIEAWKRGCTGFPLVDACMRCLEATGYLNFRMRAMLVSILTHHFACDWRDGVAHLARMFLDFEPGIHYAQFQMQAGVTGINTIRIYNPSKQAAEQDPDGIFIKRWIPELSQVPTPLLFEPWLLTDMEAVMYQIPHDSVYLNPVVDLKQTASAARERLWGWRKADGVKQESARILARHVRSKGN